MFPVIYTPTEAEAIANYSHLFRRSEGLFLSPPRIETMEDEFLDACAGRELELVGSFRVSASRSRTISGRCVGCRGDSRHRRSGGPNRLPTEHQRLMRFRQGSGGIGISAAKAVIYTLAAGVDPSKTLAVVLDVGTNNEDLLKDDLYIGYREKTTSRREVPSVCGQVCPTDSKTSAKGLVAF